MVQEHHTFNLYVCAVALLVRIPPADVMIAAESEQERGCLSILDAIKSATLPDCRTHAHCAALLSIWLYPDEIDPTKAPGPSTTF